MLLFCYYFIFKQSRLIFFTAILGTLWDNNKVAILIYLFKKGIKLEIYKEFLSCRALVVV